MIYLVDFDGEFDDLMRALAGLVGSVFDAIFQHVADPPPIPVASNAEAFVKWTADHLLRPLVAYSAYPGVTVNKIKALAAAAGAAGGGEVRPFLVILPAKSHLAFGGMTALIRTLSWKVHRDLEKVGTPHMVQFVPLEDQQVGFFTAYDGSFDTYIADFTRNIGEVFDLIFKFIKDPPPSPCRKHLQEFIDFAAAASRDPIGFYQGYPGLSNQDIHALLADAKEEAGSGRCK